MSCLGGFSSNVITMTYFAVTLALNVVLTSLIIFRLWQCKVQLQDIMGEGHGKHYNVISTVFVESAFMNAVCSILLLASSLTNGTTMGALLDIWVAATPAVQVSNVFLIAIVY